MKAGIVGVGAVGAATAMAIALRARIQELVLVNRDRARAKGVATDMRYGGPVSPLIKIEDGDYSDLAGAGVVVIAAGVNEKAAPAFTVTVSTLETLPSLFLERTLYVSACRFALAFKLVGKAAVISPDGIMQE